MPSFVQKTFPKFFISTINLKRKEQAKPNIAGGERKNQLARKPSFS